MAENPLRVLLLTPALPSDEQARVPTHILQEIRHLAELPIELHVITGNRTSVEIPRVTFHVLPRTRKNPLALAKVLGFAMRNLGKIPGITCVSLRRFYLAVKKNWLIGEFLRECPVDVIHSHWAFPEGTGGTWAASQAGLPVVMTLRGVDINRDEEVDYGYRLNAAYEHILRRSLQVADRITVASSYSRGNVDRLIGSRSKTRMVPNGLDVEMFCAGFSSILESGRKLGLARNGFTVFTLGELVRNKRFEVIVKAVALLRQKGHEVTCLIGGEGPMRADLESQIGELGVGSCVKLLGALHFSTVPDYYAACDAFVFASAAEGFCNVLLEAMAMARPVITTPVGMAEDTVKDGVNGLLVPFDDPEAMAERIQFLMNNPEKAREIGDRARETVVPRFSMQNRVKAFYDLYVECLREKGRLG